MPAHPGSPDFKTTLWSVVLRAGAADGHVKSAALDQLCRFYWKPLYVHSLRSGRTPEDAEDLTQSFFAQFLLRDSLRVADPGRGRFRAFLLVSFKNFIRDEWDRQRCAKRGGGAVHVSLDLDFGDLRGIECHDGLTPDRAFDRQWALDLVARATDALRDEMTATGKEDWFRWIMGEGAGAPYVKVAAELDTTEEAVKSFAKRTRRRFKELLERQIADTAGSPEDAAEEMAYVIELLRE